MKNSPSIHLLTHLSQDPGIGGMIFLSLLLHGVAISVMFFLPNLASSRIYYSPVYSVRLVNVAPSLPPAGKADSKKEASPPPARPAEKEKPKEMEKPKEQEKPKEKKEKEKPVSLASKPKEDPGKKIAQAIDRIRQRKDDRRVDAEIDRLRQEQQEKRIDSAIDRIRSEREAAQISSAIERIRKQVTIGSAGAVATGEPGTGGSSSGFMSIKHKMYYNLIWQRIRNAWVLPEEVLRGKKDLETVIAIRIAKDGQIEDIQFEKKSGNPYLDESALRAIKKANPLPPLPSGFEGDKFDVGVRFTPSDL
jgi:colicin import membrane protein